MTELQATKPRRASVGKAAGGRLVFLELSASRILSMNPDGSDRRVIVTDCRMPDGVAVDARAIPIEHGDGEHEVTIVLGLGPRVDTSMAPARVAGS